MERLAAALLASGGTVEIVSRIDLPPPPPAARRLERQIRRGIRHGRTPLSNTLFTADWPAWDLSAHPAVAAADLVNVHWVAGLLAAGGIRRIVESGRPVAWTLHDMRPFTGGCHYSSGCEGFTANCKACPQLAEFLAVVPERALSQTRRRLAGLPLTFVAPSRWLAGELSRSSVFDPVAHAVRVIPNGIDLARYSPGDRLAARRQLGLREDGLAILLGSVSLAEQRKGAATAAEAVARAAADLSGRGVASHFPLVVTYGSGAIEIPGVACHHLGSLDESGVLAAIHACDVHLTMAREDNLPNTVMEALACGLPVIATRAGGHTEMVSDRVEGWLVDVDDAAAAAAVIVRLVQDSSPLRAAAVRARHRAQAEWDDRLQAHRYLALAAELCDAQRATASTSQTAATSQASPTRLTPSAAAMLHRGGSLRGPLRHLRRLSSRRLSSPW
jgi:glycosyltransferase involved in cell wall biosynthesis